MCPAQQIGARILRWTVNVSQSDMHLTYLGGWSIDGEELNGVKTKRGRRLLALPLASGWTAAEMEANPQG